MDGNPQDAPKAVILEHLKTVQLAGCLCPSFTTIEQSWNDSSSEDSHLDVQTNDLLFPQEVHLVEHKAVLVKILTILQTYVRGCL